MLWYFILNKGNLFSQSFMFNYSSLVFPAHTHRKKVSVNMPLSIQQSNVMTK